MWQINLWTTGTKLCNLHDLLGVSLVHPWLEYGGRKQPSSSFFAEVQIPKGGRPEPEWLKKCTAVKFIIELPFIRLDSKL